MTGVACGARGTGMLVRGFGVGGGFPATSPSSAVATGLGFSLGTDGGVAGTLLGWVLLGSLVGGGGDGLLTVGVALEEGGGAP